MFSFAVNSKANVQLSTVTETTKQFKLEIQDEKKSFDAERRLQASFSAERVTRPREQTKAYQRGAGTYRKDRTLDSSSAKKLSLKIMLKLSIKIKLYHSQSLAK